MVHGGMTLVKYLLFLFNFVFWLSGIGLVVAGTVIEIKYRQYINILGDEFLSAPVVLIVCGCIITLLGFFGCCGAIRENYCMTMTFGVLLGVIMIVEMALGIACYVLKDDVEVILKQHMVAGIATYNETESPGVTFAWDRLQEEFQCCGINNYTDWRNSTVLSDTDDVPQSCCIPSAGQSTTTSCGANTRSLAWNQANLTIFTEGCVDQFKSWVVVRAAYVGGITCALASLQVLGICFACCLSKSILKDFEEFYY